VYHRKKLTRQFRSDEPSVRAAVERAEDANPWEGSPLGDQGPQEEDSEKADQVPDTVGEAIEMHSRLFGLGRAVWRAYVYQRRHPVRPEQDTDSDPLKDDPHITFRTAEFKTVLTPRYRLPAVLITDPRITEGTRITLEAFDLIRKKTSSSGVEFAVVLIPTKEIVLSEIVREQLPGAPPVFSRMVDYETRLRGQLIERLQSSQINVIDSLPRLRELARSGVLPYSDSGDGHLSPAGQRAVAELVSAAVGS
jgi:hypothetical protein